MVESLIHNIVHQWLIMGCESYHEYFASSLSHHEFPSFYRMQEYLSPSVQHSQEGMAYCYTILLLPSPGSFIVQVYLRLKEGFILFLYIF